MTYLPSKQPPAGAAIYVDGSASATQFIDGGQTVMTLNVTRTGYWAAAYKYVMTTINTDDVHTATARLRFNGVDQDTQAVTMGLRTAGNQVGGGGVHVLNPVLITSGQAITVFGELAAGETAGNLASQSLRATFVPTEAYPR